MKKRHFRFLTMLMTASMLASALPVYAQDRPAEAVIEAESVEDGCTDETEDPAGDVVVEMPEDDGVVEGDYELKVLDEDAKTARITKYLGSGTGDMTIPATLGDYSIIEIGNSAFKGIEMTSVKIPETIMSIGTYAFADCKMLQEVTVMSGSTDLEMDYNTFSNCVRLKKITLSDRVKSIPREFAYQDELLEEVVWPATLTSIGSNAFYGDKLLVSDEFQILGGKAHLDALALDA